MSYSLYMETETIRITLTDAEGVLLGTVTTTRAELSAASRKPAGALAMVSDLATQAGAR